MLEGLRKLWGIRSTLYHGKIKESGLNKWDMLSEIKELLKGEGKDPALIGSQLEHFERKSLGNIKKFLNKLKNKRNKDTGSIAPQPLQTDIRTHMSKINQSMQNLPQNKTAVVIPESVVSVGQSSAVAAPAQLFKSREIALEETDLQISEVKMGDKLNRQQPCPNADTMSQYNQQHCSKRQCTTQHLQTLVKKQKLSYRKASKQGSKRQKVVSQFFQSKIEYVEICAEENSENNAIVQHNTDSSYVRKRTGQG
jgi:hypothetical protein